MKLLLSGLLLVAFWAPLQAALPVSVDGQQLPSLAPMLERVTPMLQVSRRETSFSRSTSS